MATGSKKRKEPNRENLSPEIQEAESLFRTGQYLQAEAACKAILEKTQNDANAINIAGLCCLVSGRHDDALQYLQAGCNMHPKNAALHANLGRLYHEMKKPVETTCAHMIAVINEPGNSNYRSLLAHSARFFECTKFNEQFRQALLICLEDDDTSHQFLSVGWSSLIRFDPALADFMDLLKYEDYETFRIKIDIEKLKPCLKDQFLLQGLRRLILPGWDMERSFTFLRRYFLDKPQLRTDEYLDFLCALALQTFHNEYVWSISEDEEITLDGLKKTAKTQAEIAMAGCYAPLNTLRDIERTAVDIAENEDCPQLFRNLVKVQVHEPAEEKSIRKNIPVLGSLKDNVSIAVREQYEQNPYPRWANINRFELPENVKEMAHGKKILVAGCGTGYEAADMAMHFPYAEITAIDLSIASLSYAIRKTREIGIDNINFMQADILDLDRMDETFDFIVSSGVLHHMKDPVAGLRSLLRRLKPNGIIKIALYSAIARRNFKICQEWIKESHLPPTPQGIRTFREMTAALPESDQRRAVMDIRDFYTVSQCRDLVFHVQEHTFTLPQLKDIFKSEKLGVMNFVLQNAPLCLPLYTKMFPEDPQYNSPDNWHLFEQKNPDTFASMYNIILYRAAEKETKDANWIRRAASY